MRAGLYALLLLIVSSGVGVLLTEHQGRLILIYDTWQIEMSMVALALMLILLVFAGWALVACLGLARHLIKQLASWRKRRAYQRQLRRVRRGLQQLTEGNWRTAERLLLPGPAGSHSSALGPSMQPDPGASPPNAIMPSDWERLLRLLEAQTMLLTGQPQQCLAILTRAPLSDSMATLLRSLAHERLGDKIRAAQELCRLQDQSILSRADLERRLIPTFQQALHSAAMKKDLGAIRQLWSQLRSAWKKNPHLQISYAVALLACGEIQEGGSVLRRLLRRTRAERPSMDLFLQVASLQQVPLKDRLALIDSLAQGEWSHHPIVQLARAKLAFEEGRMEQALQLLPDNHLETDGARLALAHLCLMLDQPERAARLYDQIHRTSNTPEETASQV